MYHQMFIFGYLCNWEYRICVCKYFLCLCLYFYITYPTIQTFGVMICFEIIFFFSRDAFNWIILRGRWMLESDWLMNVLRCAIISGKRTANVVPGRLSTALQFRITSPNYFSYSKGLAIQPKPTRHWPIHKYSKQWDKNDRSFPVFATKLRFIMYVKTYSMSPALPPTRHVHTATHMKTYALMCYRCSDDFVSNS